MKKLLVIILGLAFLSSCNIIPSERSGFCLTCHRTEGVYKNLDLDASYHVSYKEKNEACIACHSDKSLGMSARAGAHEMKTFLGNVTAMELYAFEVFDETDYDARCLSCHTDVLEKKGIDAAALPATLKKIGLSYEHFVHMAYKEFSAEEHEELQNLQKKKHGGGLSEEEAERLALLEKVQRANCAECHERTKVRANGETFEDKSINYAARNPMLCAACHYEIALVEHPGKKRGQLPSEESCRRCHDGKLHGGNLRIFLADCENGTDRDNCIKCHPFYGQEMP